MLLILIKDQWNYEKNINKKFEKFKIHFMIKQICFIFNFNNKKSYFFLKLMNYTINILI